MGSVTKNNPQFRNESFTVSLITLDFETYYSKEFSLSRLPTEEYIRDARFETIGVAIKVDEEEAKWFTGTKDELHKHLLTYDWHNSALLCHNTMFDGAILKWFFNISPAQYFDTLCMARAVHGVDAGGSLASLAERYAIGEKGHEVVEAIGKRRADFTPEDLARYGRYCINDVNLTHRLFNILCKSFPDCELELIDMTIRMFTHPVLRVEDGLLVDRLKEVREEKLKLLGTLKERLGAADEEEVRSKLASNKKFAEVLISLGVTPPMKTSPVTDKPTLALAKNDEGFIALTEHEDSFVQQLCAVRLGTKSTIEESRIERFIDIGKRNRGQLPIPLKYYGAHTGRWAGADKVNFQNLPSRDKKKKTLKNAVVAPDGYNIINCDSSQIEARVLAWLAGQEDLVQQFTNGEDVYSVFASKIYEKPISKANPIERFVGKTCVLGLGYGTGAIKLRHTLKTQPPGADLAEERCKEIVDLYRETNDKIVNLWDESELALKHLKAWPLETKNGYYLGAQDALTVCKEGIRLPNGLLLRYPELHLVDNKYVYKSRKGQVTLWGGAVVENVVQALARIIVGEQMLKLRERYRPVLTVHDAAVIVVPEDETEEAVNFVVEVMSKPPDWARTLPVACEAKYAYSYGEC